MTMRRIEYEGDSIHHAIVVNQSSMQGGVDSILLIERTWFDANHNPVMNLQRMIALTEPPEGQPKTMNFLSTSYCS